MCKLYKMYAYTNWQNDSVRCCFFLQGTTPSTRCTAAPLVYSINIIANINGSNVVTELFISSNLSTFALPSNIISPNSEYEIIVSAISDAGASDPSTSISVSKL